MSLVSGRSTLNPNAPLFVPAAFRQVEDFSPEWWQLITTSTWYHNYWLNQHQGEDDFYDNADDDFDTGDVADLLPDTFDIGVGEDYPVLEVQFDDLLYEAEVESKSSPLNGTDAEAPNEGSEFVKTYGCKSPKVFGAVAN